MGSKRRCPKGHHIWYLAGWGHGARKVWKCAHCPAHTHSARLGNRLARLNGV